MATVIHHILNTRSAARFVARDVDMGQQNGKHLFCALYILVSNISALWYAHNAPVICINQQVGLFVYIEIICLC